MNRTKPTAYLSAMLCLLVAVCLRADIAALREGGGIGHVGTPFDCTDIDRTSNDLGGHDRFELKASQPRYSLIGIKRLFAELPLQSGQDIISARLTLHAYWGDGDTVTVYRCLTDWMTGRPGENESQVTGQRASLDEDMAWVAGAFSLADYDAANGVSVTWDNPCYRRPYVYDVTGIVKSMYDSHMNFGFVVAAEADTKVRIFGNVRGEEDMPHFHTFPCLEIAYATAVPALSWQLTADGLLGRKRSCRKQIKRFPLCTTRPSEEFVGRSAHSGQASKPGKRGTNLGIAAERSPQSASTGTPGIAVVRTTHMGLRRRGGNVSVPFTDDCPRESTIGRFLRTPSLKHRLPERARPRSREEPSNGDTKSN